VQQAFNKQQSLEQKAKASLFPERVFQEFEGKSSSWWQFDPRVDHLIALLKQHKRSKFLLICAHADTAIALEEAVRVREGIRASVFHEGMTIVERDMAAAYFAQEDNSAQMLICSEIGSEGRNFQFAHHLVLFDLPLNPDLLEQRIGRLDRIGQTQDIQIHIPYFAAHPQQVLLDWYQQGLQALSQTCQTGRSVFEQVCTELFELLAATTVDQEAVQSLITKSAELNQQLKQKLEQGRDKLLEINSSGQGKARDLAEAIAALDDETKLPMFMLRAWDVLGVNQDDRGENSMVLTMSEHLHSHYPMLDDDGISVTFDRATALAQEDIQFLSWDHPMVQGTLDILTNEQMGNSSVALLPNKALPAGTYFVEFVFIVEASAPKELQLGRYLPVTPVRLLLEKNGKNLAANVGFEQFNKQLKPVGRQPAAKMVKALQSFIHPLIGKAQELATARLVEVQQQAQELMQQKLNAQIERLQALQKLNPSVRPEEIAYLQQQQQELTDYISKARLKFDALRVVVVSHD
jgi:ATP-dependent helicase HepA